MYQIIGFYSISFIAWKEIDEKNRAYGLKFARFEASTNLDCLRKVKNVEKIYEFGFCVIDKSPENVRYQFCLQGVRFNIHPKYLLIISL